MSEENYKTHTLKRPEDCTCNGSRHCNICDGGLSFCTACNGGESELEEKSCAQRQMENEKNRLIADILASPHEWDRFYIFADWLDDQGLEVEAEQWRWRGQLFGQWADNIAIGKSNSTAKELSKALERTINDDIFSSVVFNRKWSCDELWCKKHNVRYVPKWPVSVEDVRKGREG